MEQDADFLKEGVRALSQALMELEIQEHVGVGRHERAETRTGRREALLRRRAVSEAEARGVGDGATGVVGEGAGEAGPRGAIYALDGTLPRGFLEGAVATKERKK